MEYSIRNFTIYAALILTGLSAGLFYAWAISVIPGTKKVADFTYLETMQSINRAILNPGFFLVFIGSLILLVVASIQQYGTGMSFWLTAGACFTYFAGTFLVTGLGNVPLNNLLDVLLLQEMNTQELIDFRKTYEFKWNQFHTIRTVFSVISFLLSLGAVISHTKNIYS